MSRLKSRSSVLLVKGNGGEAQEIVLEVIQVPADGLAIEAGTRIADGVIQVARGFNLEARKGFDDSLISRDNLRVHGSAGAIGAEVVEERDVAEVFFEIGAVT